MKYIIILAVLLSGCAIVAPIDRYSISDIPKMLAYEKTQENAALNKKLRKIMEFKIPISNENIPNIKRRTLHLRIAPGGVIVYVSGGKIDWWQ